MSGLNLIAQYSSGSEAEESDVEEAKGKGSVADRVKKLKETEKETSPKKRPIHSGPTVKKQRTENPTVEENVPNYNIVQSNYNVKYSQQFQPSPTPVTKADRKRKRRGRDEIPDDVEFIDVNAYQHMQTNISTNGIDLKSHILSGKSNTPKISAGSKNHITDLVKIAKERDGDLHDQWQKNKMTKKQTNAKYGF
eukprot:Nk52_evm66s1444 gene=Nk52_evmTU66s1444